jgi:hypothetical protein
MNKSAANALVTSEHKKRCSLFTGVMRDDSNIELKSMSNESPNIMIED